MSSGRRAPGVGTGSRNSKNSSWKKSDVSTSHRMSHEAAGRPIMAATSGPLAPRISPAGRKPRTSWYQVTVRSGSSVLNATCTTGIDAAAITGPPMRWGKPRGR